MSSSRLPILGLLAASLAASSAQAIGVVDASGDFLATYTGAQGGDLDVLGAFVTYNPNTQSFVFAATMDADIGSTVGAFYVFGVNRGAGTAGFAANGLPDVLFDRVVILRPDGTGTVAGQAISTVNVGSTILAEVSASLLPSTGFAAEAYTWNLWPRLTGIAGFAAIPDFAPDAVNAPVTVLTAVPEPGAMGLMAMGLAGLALVRRRTGG
jgi:hypothetical protein